MILNRLALRNFRGVKDARFDALSEKLCLFYGPNESGKSTLVEGLHFGLFEKAKGEAEHKREVWSWGGDDAPEVEVSFTDDNGETWHVHKRFLDRPFTTLEGRNVVAKDADAEARLRAIFGTRPGGNRAMKPEELGIWPLLWVRQGQSGTPTRDALVPDARALT
jgi:DNA repair exonuclease SbcCD ATPase subunit